MEIEETHGNTYVFDHESPLEQARLYDQDKMLTKYTGGILSGVDELPENAKVLDLACGPGSWVLEMAYAHTDYEVAGIDISRVMIDWANLSARNQHLYNASFGVMDITQPLDFSDNTFNLVNARFLFGVLKRESWEPLLVECMRILAPGGILRWTEPINLAITGSVPYQALVRVYSELLWKSGYGFSVDGLTLNIIAMLPNLLDDLGYQEIIPHAHLIDFSRRHEETWSMMFKDFQATSESSKAAMQRLNTSKETIKQIETYYQQAMLEWQAPSFYGMWALGVVSAKKPL